MAQYKYRENLTQTTVAAFETRHAPGTKVQNPGIYRCPGCGDEVVAAKGDRLPPATHHPHTKDQGKIEWQLVVFAEQRK
jgi:hypothetical protein